MLIDGGPDSSVIRALSEVMAPFDRTIDVVLITHTDKDHIGGIPDVLNRYEVGKVIATNNQGDTSTVSLLKETVTREGSSNYVTRVDQTLYLGASTTFAILSPTLNSSEWETNTASIVGQLRFGEVEFMLTGDAPSGIEEYLAKKHGKAMESEVLKLGHHGSKTSTAENFLAVVEPRYAVVSAGKNNRYGHPHQEVIDRLESRGISIRSTAESGNLTFFSDGMRVWEE